MKELGADVNIRSAWAYQGWTPLHFAALFDVNLTRVFVQELGAEVNAGDREGMTPLHCASRDGIVDTARVLVTELDADVNKKDIQGYTPLHHAAANDKVDVARVLVKELGVDVNTKNQEGWAPFILPPDGAMLAQLAHL